MVEKLYTPEQLAQAHQQLWQCVLQFANLSAVQERNRIARDLHDSLGHALTALNFQLQTAMKLCKPDPNQAQEFLNEAHRLVTIATQEVRQSVHGLRNDELETQSIETLVDSLVDDLQQTTGILPAVEIDLPIPLPSQFVIPLYRITQEALNNVRKYAQATAVQIKLRTTSTAVHLMIRDNGRGFDLEQVSTGYGLRGMQERLAVFQGELCLESQLGAGCCITAEIPMQLSSPEEPAFLSQSDPEEPVLLGQVNPEEPAFLSQAKSIKMGEWQPFSLHIWQEFASLEPMVSQTDSLSEMQSFIPSSDFISLADTSPNTSMDIQPMPHSLLMWTD